MNKSLIPRSWKVFVLGLASVSLSVRAQTVSNSVPPFLELPVAIQAAATPWNRIVMIGASASAGFIEAEPFGGSNTAPYRLDRYFDAALPGPRGAITNFAVAAFFMLPEAHGANEIAEARKAEPSLLVALDFLFWFCYGEVNAEPDRIIRFQKGLRLLEGFSCPVLVGDIPDASAAIDRMLRASQVPSAATMNEANRLLQAWAKARPNIVLISLHDFMRDAAANRPITLHGVTWDSDPSQPLLQNDRLHPTLFGDAFLALAALDALAKAHPEIPSEAILWNPREVLKKATNSFLRGKF